MSDAAKSEIDLSKVVFTKHALQQFERRHSVRCGATLRNPERTARKFLAGASEKGAISGAVVVRRLISNNFQPVRYAVNSPWRFVIKEDNDQLVVLTIEPVDL